jgi:predicted enzyme related to lactoylglutathione lyase
MATTPTYANGKICYLEIPAVDIQASSSFYDQCFGWTIRADNSGHTSFDDTINEVSGMWVTGTPAMKDPGIIISIMVDDASATSQLIRNHGGEIVKERVMSSGEIIVHFRDPAGNFFGLYQGS